MLLFGFWKSRALLFSGGLDKTGFQHRAGLGFTLSKFPRLAKSARRGAPCCLYVRLTGAEKKDGHADAVLDAGGRRAQEEVSEEAVAMSAHRDQVAAFVFDPPDDLVRGFAVREFGVSGDIFGLQFGLDLV